MELLQIANLGVRFLLEIGVLAALAYWGVRTGRGLVAKIGLGFGAPLLGALLWGAFAAPGAPVTAVGPANFAAQVAIFGAAAAALAAAHHPRLAWLFGGAVALNTALMYVWGQ